jgi:hypothetical protein
MNIYQAYEELQEDYNILKQKHDKLQKEFHNYVYKNFNATTIVTDAWIKLITEGKLILSETVY